MAGKPIDTLLFSGHALRQMFERAITSEDVRAVIEEGEVIGSYPDDRPYPSELLLAHRAGRVPYTWFWHIMQRSGLGTW